MYEYAAKNAVFHRNNLIDAQLTLLYRAQIMASSEAHVMDFRVTQVQTDVQGMFPFA